MNCVNIDIEEQYDKIYRFCYLRVKNRETAEDITQETFLRYLEHPQYHQLSKTLELLYTIAGNLCIDEFRKRTSAELPEETNSGEDVERSVLADVSLKQALEKLDDSDREMILLRYINDVPINAIAGIFGISRFAVSRRIKRILAQLHSEIGKEDIA